MWVSTQAAENERKKAGAAITLIFKIYFWLRWVFVAAPGFLQLEQGPLSSCGARASCCGGFSCCGARAPGHMSFSSYGAQA